MSILICQPRLARWTPAAFGANLVGWWDFSKFEYLYQDSGRTTVVTGTSQTVASVTDRSGNGRHFTQPTSSCEPTVVAEGSLYGLSFDGVDDWLYASSGATIGEHTVVMRTQFDSVTSRYAWWLDYSVSEVHYSYNPSGASYYLNRGSGASVNAAGGWASLGTQANYVWVCSGSSPYGEWFKDGVSQATITSSPGTNSRSMTLHLHADNTGAARAQAVCCEVMLIDKALNATEVSQVSSYLAAKWVLPWRDDFTSRAHRPTGPPSPTH